MENSETEELAAQIRRHLQENIPAETRNDPQLRAKVGEELKRALGDELRLEWGVIPLLRVLEVTAEPDGSVHVLLSGPRELLQGAIPREPVGPSGIRPNSDPAIAPTPTEDAQLRPGAREIALSVMRGDLNSLRNLRELRSVAAPTPREEGYRAALADVAGELVGEMSKKLEDKALARGVMKLTRALETLRLLQAGPRGADELAKHFFATGESVRYTCGRLQTWGLAVEFPKTHYHDPRSYGITEKGAALVRSIDSRRGKRPTP